MDDLITFWRARLDEDVAIAQADARYEGDDWKVGPPRPGELEVAIFDDDGTKVMAQVEADRAILARYEALTKPRTLGERLMFPSLAQVALDIIRIRVAVYSDHPDYRPEWKP